MNLYRPLSPHLLIYRPQLNALGSILHRFTGAYISLILILFIFALKFVAQNVHIHFIYLFCHWAHSSMAWIVISCLSIFVISFFYHLVNGVRHLFWDLGWLLDKKALDLSTYFVLFITGAFYMAVILSISILFIV